MYQVILNLRLSHVWVMDCGTVDKSRTVMYNQTHKASRHWWYV